MRLRLRIERNELPPVSVLWAIGDTELKQTVAQFVERVNERFPLEGESWGLEDYAVSVGGYEALHYTEVGTCFQSEDEVLIKPLQYVDARARTITGRDQITEDGRHLLDGVPFGRPLLKRPRRPEVRIPPRKRQRVEELGAIEGGAGDENALVRFEELDEDDDDDEEDDDDFDLDADADESDEDEVDESEDEIQQELPKARTNTKRVKFDDARAQTQGASLEAQQEASSSGDSSDSSEEDDSSDSSVASSEDSSDEDSDESQGSDNEEWDGIASSDPKSPANPTPATNGTNMPKQQALTNGVHSTTQDNSPPGEGDPKTQYRNARRREQRQLKHLKESGMLAPTAKMDDMKKMLEAKALSSGSALRDVAKAHKQKMESQRQKLLSDIASGGVEVTNGSLVNEDDPDDPPDEEPIVPARPAVQALLDQQLEVEQPRRTSGSVQDKLPIDDMTSTLKNVDQDDPVETDSAISLRRKRLDLAATNRLVFGNLGVRTPKTQADKDALQKKLLTRSQRARPPPQLEEAPQAPEPEEQDPGAWQDKIEISAVECCDEGVTLSAPPFPFKQYWDPQYQVKKRKSGSGNLSKRRKKRKTNGGAAVEYVETYDKYNKDGSGDALDYDDPVDDGDEYWEDGALLDDEYEDDSESDEPTERQIIDDGFPKLPDDISSLPSLAEVDAKQNDYVVYTELSCSAATNWEPKMITRTARLDNQEDGGWKVTFAHRDQQSKEYDDDGNRVYRKFEMEGASDDEDEEVSPVLVWSALQEPKLLQRASE